MKTTTYDAMVIGTGQSGPYVTSRLAGAGMKVAVNKTVLMGMADQPCDFIDDQILDSPRGWVLLV